MNRKAKRRNKRRAQRAQRRKRWDRYRHRILGFGCSPTGRLPRADPPLQTLAPRTELGREIRDALTAGFAEIPVVEYVTWTVQPPYRWLVLLIEKLERRLPYGGKKGRSAKRRLGRLRPLLEFEIATWGVLDAHRRAAFDAFGVEIKITEEATAAGMALDAVLTGMQEGP